MADQLMAENRGKPERKPRSEMHRRQRTKNLVLSAVLLAFAVLVYFVAIVRMGGG